MNKLGISIYPEHSTREKDEAYLTLASSYGFSRVFTCLLSVEQPKQVIIDDFTKLFEYAHSLGYEISVDTNPKVIEHLGASPQDLKVFKDMGVDIIRLDGSYGAYLDMVMTNNPYGLIMEFNGSIDNPIEYMIEHGANSKQMSSCSNFYPQRYTGLGYETLKKHSQKYQKAGLRTAAFITSQNKDTYGPWPVSDGLCTVEDHRDLPVSIQARHLLASKVVDDILFANAYASEEELKALSMIDTSKITLGIDLDQAITNEEKSIITNYIHSSRPDHSDYILRSSMPRLDYRNVSIPARVVQKEMFERGDVLIVNDQLAHYRGELQVVLKPIKNRGTHNLVGTLNQSEQLILNELEIHYDHLFGFIINKGEKL